MSTPDTTLANIIALYADYVASIDEERFDDWPGFFTEDCTYRVIPRENHDAGYPLATMSLKGTGGLRDRVYGVTSTLFHAHYYQRHIVGLPRILGTESGEIRVEANYLVIRTKRDETSDVFNAGRYLDRIVSTRDGLRFREKLCVFDSELIPNSLIYPI